MNAKFYELALDKQDRIINAGFEVFSKNEYKHASTEDIAVKAGISKGLLFYYFHDKKTLYLFLYDYAEKLLLESVVNDRFFELGDIFDMFAYAAERKYIVLEKSPYVMDFVMQAYYSQKEAVSGDLNARIEKLTGEMYGTYFKHCDFSKFKDGVNPIEILQMMTWMADGYLHELQRTNTPIVLDDLMLKYNSWSRLFKEMSYKEEYLK